MGFRAIVYGGMVFGLLAISLAAQQKPPATPPNPAPPQPAARFQARIDLITLDVSVLDRDRHPVHGLTAADFTILEDGKPLPVQTFLPVDLPDVEEAPASWVRATAPDVRRNDDLADRRLLTIILDDALPGSAHLGARAREMAHAVVDRMGPRDLAAVIFPLSQRDGQDYTADRTLLAKAIDRYGGPSLENENTPMRLRMYYESLVRAIRVLTENLQDVPDRRKALVVISQGIPLDVTAMGTRQSLSSGEDPGGLLHNVVVDLHDAFAAAERANVNVYTMDPAGLDPDAVSTKLDFLRSVAETTGGFAMIDTNDVGPGVTQMFRENSSYYLLGYTSPNARADGRFHKVEVRVNRPGLTVRARNGYYDPERAKPAAAKAKTPPAPIWTALAAVLPKGDVAMQVSAIPFAIPGKKEAAVAVVTGLRQPAPPGTDRVTEHVDVFIGAYSTTGDRKAARRLDTRIVLRPERSGDIGYEVIARVDLKPGRYQLRVAAQSSMQGKAGSVFYDLEVPDFSKGGVSLSGLAMTATPARASAPKDALAGVISIVPTTEREFPSTDRAAAFVRVYQGGSGALAAVPVHARIVDGRGATVFETTETLGPERFAAARAADYRLEVPLAQMKAGLHLLSIEAGEGKRIASREVRFTVR